MRETTDSGVVWETPIEESEGELRQAQLRVVELQAAIAARDAEIGLRDRMLASYRERAIEQDVLIDKLGEDIADAAQAAEAALKTAPPDPTLGATMAANIHMLRHYGKRLPTPVKYPIQVVLTKSSHAVRKLRS